MLTKRIIPCLDVKDGKTVKGINFENIKDVGDPVELGKFYAEVGADELVFLDITATHEKRKTLSSLVKKIAKNINIPFTVGGGISSVEDVSLLLQCGADKISINSAAVRNPQLINEISSKFGSQVCVCAIDARQEANGEWYCYVKGGRERTEHRLFDWAAEVADRGAGEILFTSMNHDGVKTGYANEALAQLSTLPIPIIASGGVGSMQHFYDAFTIGKADAALAASVFHFGEINIKKLKRFLNEKGVKTRI